MAERSTLASPATDSRVRTSAWVVTAVILAVLLVDQIIKIWVKTSFYMGEDLPITSWWHLKFIENNGMAFGMELWNKLVLTFGRIIVVGLLIWCLVKMVRMEGLRRGCAEQGVPTEEDHSMSELGRACRISVGAAVAVLLK